MSVGPITYIFRSLIGPKMPTGATSSARVAGQNDPPEEKAGKVGQRMEKAAEETVTEEIIVSPEEIADEVKEEVKKAPSRLRQKLRQLEALWERAGARSSASGSEAVGSGLAGMYGAKFQALAKEHERARPDKS